MQFEVHDGRILTWALEAHAVDHCNLRCTECCTLSPFLGERFLDVDGFARDLERARSALRPHVFKLTGGEPLLHPRIADLAAIVRASGIATQVSLTTNGWLFDRAPDDLLASLDRLTLSHYSSAPLPVPRMREIARRCEAHDVSLTVKRVDRFARMTPVVPLDDAAARAAHEACWLKVRCHLMHQGRFYVCTRPPHLAELIPAPQLVEADGVELSGSDLLGRLLRHLERPDPYASCRHCLGSTGGWIAHAQVPTTRADA